MKTWNAATKVTVTKSGLTQVDPFVGTTVRTIAWPSRAHAQAVVKQYRAAGIAAKLDWK